MRKCMKSLLVAHGGLILLVGMLTGFPLAFEILGGIEIWPSPGLVEFRVPGDLRAWRMAHLQGILNGLLLIGIGAAGAQLRLTIRAERWIGRGLLACGWGNMMASLIGPLAGVRGLAFTGMGWNSLVFVLFMTAVVGGFVSIGLVLRGALMRLHEESSTV